MLLYFEGQVTQMTTINATQVIDEYLFYQSWRSPSPLLSQPDHAGPSLYTSLRFGSIVYDYRFYEATFYYLSNF